MSPELYESIKSLIDYAVGSLFVAAILIGIIKMLGFCIRNSYLSSIEKSIDNLKDKNNI